MLTQTVVPYDLFSRDRRMDAPLYQRPYVWGQRDQWEPLWEDVCALAESHLSHASPDEGHFLGAIVLQTRQTGFSLLEAATIIDGQQRLTTLQILLHALYTALADHGLDDLARRVRRLTENDIDPATAHPEDSFKVWPTNRDRDAYAAVMRAPGKTAPATPATPNRFAQAHAYFQAAITQWLAAPDNDPEVPGPAPTTSTPTPERLRERADALVAVAIRGLRMVAIFLDPTDDAQAIFETLNARGTPLTPMDLVKNFLLQGMDPHSPETQAVYERHWKRFETPFWEQETGLGRARQVRSVAFLQWWLTARTGKVTPSRSVFSTFKRHTQGPGGGELAVLADLSAAAQRYERLQVASGQSHGELSPLEMFNYRIDALGLDVLKPLVIWLQDPTLQAVPEAQHHRLLAAVESWVVRRALVKERSTGLNRFIVEQLMRQAATDPNAMGERVEELLASQTAPVSYWPDDDELRVALVQEPIYRTLARARVRMVLEAIEDQRRGYPDGHRRAEAPAPRGRCTIEHLLPQQWRTSWDEGADEATAARRDVLVHTLGNLTLTTQALNSSLSNGPWGAKRDALETSSSLLTTREVTTAHPQAWGEADIQERTAALAEDVLAIWPAPPGHVRKGVLREPQPAGASGLEGWNGRDWYVSFGQQEGGRQWQDARRYGFVSGGGGAWYSRTLRNLPPGARVLVYVPGSGYVGVGTVTGPPARFDQAQVSVEGAQQALAGLPLAGSYHHQGGPGESADDVAEWVVPVAWEHTVPVDQAVWEPGMFANQNTAARLRHQATVAAVLEGLGLG